MNAEAPGGVQAIPRFAMDGLDSGTLTVKVDFVKGHVVLALAQSLR